jgi:hypothetical protein
MPSGKPGSVPAGNQHRPSDRAGDITADAIALDIGPDFLELDVRAARGKVA